MDATMSLLTNPQPAKATNKRKRLSAVLDKLTSNMTGSPELQVSANTSSCPDKQTASTHLEISLSMAEERSTSEESEEERPNSSSSAVSSPKTESSLPHSPTSNLFFSSLLASPRTPPGSPTVPPGLDYLKSQLLGKMYLHQYMTNNMATPFGLQTQIGTKERPCGKGTLGPRLTKEEEIADSTPLDLSKTGGPAQTHNRCPISYSKQYPFPTFAPILIPSSTKEEKGVSPPPSSPFTSTVNIKGVVETSSTSSVSTYSCPVCSQQFSLHDRLAKHMASRHKAHKSEPQAKAYFCEVCKRSFARSDMLTRHVRLHTGLKPYTCRVCGQVFSRSDHLSTHQRTHTGEKPYKCPSCPYSACRRDMITRHMRTHSRYSLTDTAALVEAAQREARTKLESGKTT